MLALSVLFAVIQSVACLTLVAVVAFDMYRFAFGAISFSAFATPVPCGLGIGFPVESRRGVAQAEKSVSVVAPCES